MYFVKGMVEKLKANPYLTINASKDKILIIINWERRIYLAVIPIPVYPGIKRIDIEILYQ